MTLPQALLLSFVEGITEFLPVSSTFHLLLVSDFLGLRSQDFVDVFIVVIQSGAILAVGVLYAKKILSHPRLIRLTAAAFIPTALVGFALYQIIKSVLFHTPLLSVTVFILVGFAFILFERAYGSFVRTKSILQMGIKEAIIIGIIQSVAVIPGVSRSGAVLLGLMGMGYSRQESAEFSFLLAVPTILAASAYDLFRSWSAVQFTQNATPLMVGTVGSFIAAYISMRWFIGFLKTHRMDLFGWYRIVLGIILLFTL